MTDRPYRLLVILVAVVVIVVIARRRARAGSVARRVPDHAVQIARGLLWLPALVSLLVYLVHPRSVAALQLPLPVWVRALGAALTAVATALIAWAFLALDHNFSGNLVIHDDHTLVQRGPYRWVRHPMYALGLGLFLALALVTGLWPVAAFGAAGMAVTMIVRVPREERMLAERFGDAWHAYAARTGRFVPRPRGSRDSGPGRAERGAGGPEAR